jgi:hypothetical protein
MVAAAPPCSFFIKLVIESSTFKRNVALVSFSNLEGTNVICFEMDELKDFRV